MGHTFPPDDDPSVGALDNEGRSSGRPFTAAAQVLRGAGMTDAPPLGTTEQRRQPLGTRLSGFAVGRECQVPGLLESIKLGGINLETLRG